MNPFLNQSKFNSKVLRGINDVLAFVDAPFLAQGKQDAVPPLFVVGVPRSGTTLTYQIITSQFDVAFFVPIMNYLYGIPNMLFRLYKPFIQRPNPSYQSKYGRVSGIFSPSETGPIWDRWFPWDEQESHYVRTDDTILLEPRLQNLKRNLDSFSAIMQKPLVIKCVYLSMVVSVLAKLLPEARFIYVQRDLLMISQSLFIGRQKQKDPTRWWSVKPPQIRQIMEKPIWQQVVEQAYYTDKLLQIELNQFAEERTFHINYEALCETPHHIVEALGNWLEPVGYRQFTDLCLPASFQVSKRYSLDKELLSKMRSHLETLSSMERLS